MKNIPLLLGTILATLALVVGVAIIFSKKANAPIEMTRVVGDTTNATGSAQPVATIVEFSDFQCPACKAVQPLVKEIVDKNLDKVRFIYRHYPLPQHQNAQLAALAAETAASVGKFWQYHDVLFETQSDWEKLSNDDAAKKFAEYAQSMGIPSELMQQSLKTKTFEQRVLKDMSDAGALGVSSTPTFYLNGQKMQIDQLQAAVENLLK